MSPALEAGIEIAGAPLPGMDDVLTSEAVAFVADLQRTFGARRLALLDARGVRRERIAAGEQPAMEGPVAGDWKVAAPAPGLVDRRVEITGPLEAKMTINALNSGARVFMADIEDSLSPTWQNVLAAQSTLSQAVRGTLEFTNPDGKQYRLGDELATLVVRPRGWHLPERHLLVDSEPVSASLFDFGLAFFTNAAEQVARGAGPYFYLPKLEHRDEARLWNDVFVHAQARIGMPKGTIRATVLIETVLAALDMDGILYELREHSAGLNAGRWDYIFSAIKNFRDEPGALLPDRAQVTMRVPFMHAYSELLVRTCHARGAHAIGGMSAFIPSRRDPEVNERALAQVSADKEREAGAGFDGTWVAHPDLVPVALRCFDAVLGERSDQRGRMRDDVEVGADDLLGFAIEGATVSEAGVRSNISIAIRYIASWLAGTGAAAIENLMEDAATAEISRAQLWQWRRHGAQLDDGRTVDAALYREIRAAESAALPDDEPHHQAAELLDRLVLSDDFEDFLTLPAYALLD